MGGEIFLEIIQFNRKAGTETLDRVNDNSKSVLLTDIEIEQYFKSLFLFVFYLYFSLFLLQLMIPPALLNYKSLSERTTVLLVCPLTKREGEITTNLLL